MHAVKSYWLLKKLSQSLQEEGYEEVEEREPCRMQIPQFGFVWSVGTVISVCTGRERAPDVSERWHPVGQGSLGSWSERHCLNCSLWGWQRCSRCQQLLQYCSAPLGKGVPEESSLSGLGVQWRTQRRWRKGCPRERCCPLAAPAAPDHRRGGASPSLCVGRRSRSSEPCCSRCTSRWLFCHSSSSSGETEMKDGIRGLQHAPP